MPLFHALILGIVQALTEYVPVSSTAHLLVFGQLLGQDPAGDKFRAFTTIIQMGTSVAVVAFFRADLWKIAVAGLQSVAHRAPFESADSRLAWLIVLGTIPAAVIGKLFEKRIEGLGNWVIAGSLLALGLVLLGAELLAKHERAVAGLSVPDALLVGFGQALALVPGCSRSGTTITTGLLLGLRREDAARFSFLLSVPIILGAGAYKVYKVRNAFEGDAQWRNATLLGTVVSGLLGYVVIGWFLGWLRQRTTLVFVVWRVVAAIAIAVLLSRGLLPEGKS